MGDTNVDQMHQDEHADMARVNPGKGIAKAFRVGFESGYDAKRFKPAPNL
ncbi:MAG: hypothetical protein JKY94_08985 [Rhodobacteraceae bacterium]|nr:hypothetical protein [Paracoccaceae bacterium]